MTQNKTLDELDDFSNLEEPITVGENWRHIQMTKSSILDEIDNLCIEFDLKIDALEATIQQHLDDIAFDKNKKLLTLLSHMVSAMRTQKYFFLEHIKFLHDQISDIKK